VFETLRTDRSSLAFANPAFSPWIEELRRRNKLCTAVNKRSVAWRRTKATARSQEIIMTAKTERSTIVAVFQDRSQAQQAINELKRAGFRDDQIGVTSPDRGGSGGLTSESGESGGSYAAEGGGTGLAAGAGVGALWGLGIVSGILPAVGPAIAGGTLAAILSSAAAGAVAAGIAGTLIGMGIPKEDAEFYESEFKAGRTIVTVRCEGKTAEAVSILRRNGGYEKGSESGTTGAALHSHSVLHEGQPAGSAAACSTQTGKMAAAGAAGQTLQAREEQLRVRKQREQVGEVTLKKEVHTEHKTLDIPVEREEVVIERHPATGRAASSGPLQEGQTIRVPVSEEHVEITKTPVVKEEVSVSKRKVTGTQHVAENLRKEEIKVERDGEACVKDQRR
jgi:uncharacterized protein (TIGR02271 family)